jgi:hypothetical protein
MKLTLTIIFVITIVFAGLINADQLLRYEPAVSELSGKLIKGKFQHPNGEWVNYWFLRLNSPVEIKADNEENSFNESESGIKEIQLYSFDKKLINQLNNNRNKNVKVKGTIFHSHTAWHVRPLVMEVQQLESKLK